MDNQTKPVVASINKAREQGVEDALILGELKKQNPEKNVFFQKAEKRGAGATEILDEIIRQNTTQKEGEKPKAASLASADSSYQEEQDGFSSEGVSVEVQESHSQQGKESKKVDILLEFIGSLSGEKKKKGLIIGGVTLFCIFLISFIFFARTPVVVDISERKIENIELSPAEISRLTEPAIIKIGYEVTGDIITPGFVIDIETLEIQRDERFENSVFKIDHYWEGTGFIVGEDGYILTNAHVATIEELKSAILMELVTVNIYEFLIELELAGRSEELESYQKIWEKINEDSTYQENIERKKKNENEIFDDAIFSLEKKIRVFNPSSDGERLPDLFSKGFDAEVVFANENFMYDQKDIALLKIEENNLPTIKIEKDRSATMGEPIFVFGFPVASSILDVIGVRSTSFITTPNISVSGGYMSPSFTAGSVTAIKDSLDGSFSLIESEAKVSPGSSGSPVLNNQGAVIGIVSFITGEGVLESGDIMMRAVPISILEDFENKFEKFSSGNYYNDIRRGIYLMQRRHCKQAVKEFAKGVRGINDNFSTESIDVFINNCQKIIEQGRSIDTRWDAIRN